MSERVEWAGWARSSLKLVPGPNREPAWITEYDPIQRVRVIAKRGNWAWVQIAGREPFTVDARVLKADPGKGGG